MFSFYFPNLFRKNFTSSAKLCNSICLDFNTREQQHVEYFHHRTQKDDLFQGQKKITIFCTINRILARILRKLEMRVWEYGVYIPVYHILMQFYVYRIHPQKYHSTLYILLHFRTHITKAIALSFNRVLVYT